MVLYTSPFSNDFLLFLNSLSWGLIFPCYWLLDRLLASFLATSQEKRRRSQDSCSSLALCVLVSTPLYLLLFLASLPFALLGFLLWAPLQTVRRPYVYTHSRAALRRAEQESTLGGPPREWRPQGRSFCFCSSNVCLLPDSLARLNNLSDTQGRAREVGVRIRNGASRPQIKIYIDSPTNTSVSAASFSSLSQQGAGFCRAPSLDHRLDSNGRVEQQEISNRPESETGQHTVPDCPLHTTEQNTFPDCPLHTTEQHTHPDCPLHTTEQHTHPDCPLHTTEQHTVPDCPLHTTEQHTHPDCPLHTTQQHTHTDCPIHTTGQHTHPDCPVHTTGHHTDTNCPIHTEQHTYTDCPIHTTGQNTHPNCPIHTPGQHTLTDCPIHTEQHTHPDCPQHTTEQHTYTDCPIHTTGQHTHPDCPLHTTGQHTHNDCPIHTTEQHMQTDCPIHTSQQHIHPDCPLHTTGQHTLPDCPIHTTGQHTHPDCPIHTTGQQSFHNCPLHPTGQQTHPDCPIHSSEQHSLSDCPQHRTGQQTLFDCPLHTTGQQSVHDCPLHPSGQQIPDCPLYTTGQHTHPDCPLHTTGQQSVHDCPLHPTEHHTLIDCPVHPVGQRTLPHCPVHMPEDQTGEEGKPLIGPQTGDGGSTNSFVGSLESLPRCPAGSKGTSNSTLLHCAKKPAGHKCRYGENGFDHEISAFFPANLDFLCLQEVFDKRAAAKLRQQLHHYFPFVLSDVGRYAWKGCCSQFKFLNSGLLLGSRYPILDADYRCYPNGRAEDALAAKGALFVKVQVGTSSQEQRVVGYIACTHLHAIEGDASVRCKQLDLLLEWGAQFRKATSRSWTKGQVDQVAFDVILGDLNFDNCSSDDKLEQQHTLFSHYKDPCRLGPGEDQPWALGTLLDPSGLYDEEVTSPEGLQKVMENEEGRKEYLVYPTSKKQSSNQKGRKIPLKGNGRRIDYILYSEERLQQDWKVDVEEYSFITQLAGLTDHLAVAMRLAVSTGEAD